MMTHKILNRDPKDEILKVGVFRSFFSRVTGDVFAIVRPKTPKITETSHMLLVKLFSRPQKTDRPGWAPKR